MNIQAQIYIINYFNLKVEFKFSGYKLEVFLGGNLYIYVIIE